MKLYLIQQSELQVRKDFHQKTFTFPHLLQIFQPSEFAFDVKEVIQTVYFSMERSVNNSFSKDWVWAFW